MQKMILYKFGGDPHAVKLIGAFIMLVALLMFVKASADMWDSWDSVKGFETCMETVGTCDTSETAEIFTKQDPCAVDEWQQDYDACREDLHNATGISLQTGKAKLSWWQFVSALMTPMASFFFWLAVVLMGWLLYISGKVVLPIARAEGELRKGKKK